MKFIKRILPFSSYLIITSLVICIAIVNYKVGTILSGWDNLHPEFNFSANIKRSVFAVWQEYQGLGLLGGMGHASDLPRQLFLFALSCIVPKETLRYIFHFFMLLCGAIGMYVLLKRIVFEKNTTLKAEFASLSGALFYLFNLGTVQMFNVPFEPYSVHYGVLPWLFYVTIRYIKRADKRSFLLLCLVNVLAIPQGYIATFFLVYMMSIGILSLFFIFSRSGLRRVLTVIAVIFMSNAFWLLPNLYFVTHKVSVTVEAKMNQMFTEDIFLRNKKYGNLENTMLLKGFWFDNIEKDQTGEMAYQLAFWKTHIENDGIALIGYTLFGIAILGITYTCIKRKQKSLFFVPLFILSFSVLSNDAPIFSNIAEMFYKLPLFSQIFRFPFTKLSILCINILAIFYAVGVYYLIELFAEKYFRFFIGLFFLLLPVVYCYPLLTGKLFYEKEQAAIPKEYFDTFNFFKDKTGRIANFPQYTYWGWTFYKWNYSGSGFIWYGIEAPVLDRAFDVWSGENENYYYELSHAIYSADQKQFDDVLEKYQISWLYIDTNVQSNISSKALYQDTLDNLILNNKHIGLSARFGNIYIYTVDLSTHPKNYVYTIPDAVTVLPQDDWDDIDRAYSEYGSYIASNVPTSVRLYYPLRTVFSGRTQKDLQFSLKDTADSYIFTSQIPKELVGGNLILPAFTDEDIERVDTDSFEALPPQYPIITLDGEIIPYSADLKTEQSIHLAYIHQGTLEIKIPKYNGLYSYDSRSRNDLVSFPEKNCDQFNQGIYKHQIIGNTLRLISTGANNCFDIPLPNMTQRMGYVVSVKSKNIAGRGIFFSVNNSNSRRPDLEVYTPDNQFEGISHYILSPMERYGLGYTLHFDNISIGSKTTINDIDYVSMQPIPYKFLKGIKIKQGSYPEQNSSSLQIIDVSHTQPSSYVVTYQINQPSQPSYLVLSQSYDSGWHAYNISCRTAQSGGLWGMGCVFPKMFPFIFGKELTDHVRINNWENGWKLSDSQSTASNAADATHKLAQAGNSQLITILYLPQYYEYAGFTLFGVLFVWFLIYMRRSF